MDVWHRKGMVWEGGMGRCIMTWTGSSGLLSIYGWVNLDGMGNGSM